MNWSLVIFGHSLYTEPFHFRALIAENHFLHFLYICCSTTGEFLPCPRNGATGATVVSESRKLRPLPLEMKEDGTCQGIQGIQGPVPGGSQGIQGLGSCLDGHGWSDDLIRLCWAYLTHFFFSSSWTFPSFTTGCDQTCPDSTLKLFRP